MHLRHKIMPRHVLVDMPISPYEWEPARLNTPGYEFGISGTHTALLAIAQSFVQHRWSVHLAGSIHGQPLPGMTYIRAGSWSASMQPPEFDLTLISNVFTPKQCLWNKVSTRALAIVQENQFIRPLEYALLSRYMKQCQRRMGGSGDTKLIFFHLSEWTKEAMIAHLNGRVVQDYFHSNVVNVRALKDNRWAMDPWVKHDTQTFRNPINLTLFRVARQLARPRNSRSLIFPACWERGGVVAAKVFAKLKTEWGDDARIHFSYYDTARKGNAEMRTVLALANGQQQDARVTHSPLSKLDLAIRMEEFGFFVYGLVSSNGVVHFDTFASVVAESLAAGVIVLAPRLAALPYLYDGIVQFIDPPGGLSKKLRSTNVLSFDDSGLASEGMIDRYVEIIHKILKNSTLEAALRDKGRRFARKHFGYKTVMNNFVRVLERELFAP